MVAVPPSRSYKAPVRRTDPDVYKVRSVPDIDAPARIVIEVLSPLVTAARLARIEEVIAHRTCGVAPVLEGTVDPHNASAVLRSADAFGIQTVHVVEGEQGFLAAHRVAKGTHRWLDIERHATAAQCTQGLKAAGYGVYVAAMEGTLTPEDLRERGKVAVVFGNEHRGVSEAMRLGADGTFAIPMAGFVESLNVSVAAALTLRALRAGFEGDLSEKERETLKARFLANSVRDAARIVEQHMAQAG